MGKLKLKIHPLFLVVILVLICFGWINNLIFYLIALCIHEYSHIFMAKFLHYEFTSLSILPYGASLNKNSVQYSLNHEILISIIAPIVNLFVCIFLLALWWCFPTTYTYTNIFLQANLILCIFNLLPLYPMDFGRVLMCLLSKKYKTINCYKVLLFFNIIIAIIFFNLFVSSIFSIINLNYLFVFVFIVISCVDFKKELILNYSYLEKKPIDYNKVLPKSTICVPININKKSLLKYLSKHKYCEFEFINEFGKVICKMSEFELLEYLLKFNTENNFNINNYLIK